MDFHGLFVNIFTTRLSGIFTIYEQFLRGIKPTAPAAVYDSVKRIF